MDLEEIIMGETYNKFNFKIFKLPKSIQLVCSGAFVIDVDILGNEIQDVYDDKTNKSMICVNSIINNNEQFVVFGWTEKSNKNAIKLIRSFDDSNNLIEDLVYFLFIHFENICMNPSWYGGLTDSTKKILGRALIQGGDVFIPRSELFPLKEKLNLNL